MIWKININTVVAKRIKPVRGKASPKVIMDRAHAPRLMSQIVKLKLKARAELAAVNLYPGLFLKINQKIRGPRKLSVLAVTTYKPSDERCDSKDMVFASGAIGLP